MISTSQVEHLQDRMHQALRLLDLAITNGNKSKLDIDQIEACLERHVEAGEKIIALTMPKSTQVALSTVERDAEFTRTLIKIGQGLQGGVVLALDAFLDRVVES